ncbi:hypothetical protein ABZ858_22555 [Streptomyces sp. NPDC047017]|uniref:hypothetical protein n=1 Tax=Streptomyces sp. NPDC047017 TaxID=3155024 RepID=UPI0034035008
MRPTSVRRTALVASAAALALFATACGSSGDGGKDTGGKTVQPGRTAAPSSAAPAAAPLSAAELEKAALTQADVKSGKVAKVSPKEETAQDQVKVNDAACVPLGHLQSGAYVGKPSAAAGRHWTGDPKKPAADASDEEKFLAGVDRPVVGVTLAAYADGGAEQAMKDLNAAARSCAGGFASTADGEETKVLKVTRTDAPEGGDEALAVTFTLDVSDGDKMSVKAAVVRKGATLAHFITTNFASAGAGKDFPFPTEIVDAQLAKLK